MSRFTVVREPSRVDAPGGKLIEELFGRVSTGFDGFSLAHMVAPPGWSEPPQAPSFGELTLMVRGSLRLDVDGEEVRLRAGEAIWVEPGARVRYDNPSPEECEYYAFCLPAFSPERANREE